MHAVTEREFLAALAYLICILSLLVWAVLWSRRSASVHLWCLAGILGALFEVSLSSTFLGSSTPQVVGFPLLATLGVGGLLLKAMALHWLDEAPRRFGSRALLWTLVANAAVALGIAMSPASRAQFSVYVLGTMHGAAVLTTFYAYRLSRRYRLLNARLLTVTFLIPLLPALLIFWRQIAAGQDLLLTSTDPVGTAGMAVVVFLAVCNNGLFVGVVTDLAARHEAMTAVELQRLKYQRLSLEERSRLMADLHDGFGSQLASARLSAERGDLDNARMRQLLDECLSDLHLVVDTLNNKDGSLGDALRFLRHRIQGRIGEANPTVEWDLDLDSMPAMDGTALIQVLRIVQEALANAIRHASASQVRVGASYDAGRLHLSIRDDGRGFTSSSPEGHGLRNMHQRARRIGAQLQVIGGTMGTRVELDLPVATGSTPAFG